MEEERRTSGWSEREEKKYMGSEDTVQEKYDEPQEIRKAIDETPATTKELALGGRVAGWIKSKFVKSDDEVALENEAKQVYQDTYNQKKRETVLNQARSKATAAATGRNSWGSGPANAVRDVVGAFNPSVRRVKKPKKQKTQYHIHNGIAYPVSRPAQTHQQRPSPMNTQTVGNKRSLDDVLMGGSYNAGGNTPRRNPLDMLAGPTPKRKRKGNALDMLGGLR